MSVLTAPYRPASQPLWGVDLTSYAAIAKGRGTLVNKPIINEKGMNLDGVDQYAIFSLLGQISEPEITIKMVFTPDFDTDDDNYRYLYNTTPNNEYRVLKHKNSGSNVLLVYLGGSAIVSIPEATYSPYWKTNQKNVLIVSSKSNDTDVYLNGNRIVYSDGDTWNITYPTTLALGSLNLGGYFKGIINGFYIYRGKWTEDDVALDYNNSIFTYPNRASCWFDMATRRVNGSGHITKSKGNNRYTLELGNGIGNNEPTFLDPGYDLNGSTQYIQSTDIVSAFAKNISEISIVIAFEHDDFQLGTTIFYIDTSDPNYRIYKASANDSIYPTLAGISMGPVSYANWSPYAHLHDVNVLVIAAKSGNTDYYMNGHLILKGATATFTNVTSGKFFIGANRSLGYGYIDGSVYHFSLHPEKLSSQQLRDITSYLIDKYGRL